MSAFTFSGYYLICGSNKCHSFHDNYYLPLLAQIRREFRGVVDKENLKPLKKEWPEWATKIVKFARLEANSRPLICSLLQDLDNPPQLDNTEGILL